MQGGKCVTLQFNAFEFTHDSFNGRIIMNVKYERKNPPHFDIMEIAGWWTPYKQIICL